MAYRVCVTVGRGYSHCEGTQAHAPSTYRHRAAHGGAVGLLRTPSSVHVRACACVRVHDNDSSTPTEGAP